MNIKIQGFLVLEYNDKQKKIRNPRKITARYLDNVAGYYLERYPSSSANLKRVLMRRAYKSCAFHEMPLEEAEKLIDELVVRYEELGFLDNERYAYNLARQLRHKGKSKKQIEQKMYEKSVPEHISKLAMSKVDSELSEEGLIDTETLSAWRLAKRRRLGLFRRDQDCREDYWQKDLASLARAGFSYEIAKQVLEEQNIPSYIEDTIR